MFEHKKKRKAKAECKTMIAITVYNMCIPLASKNSIYDTLVEVLSLLSVTGIGGSVTTLFKPFIGWFFTTGVREKVSGVTGVVSSCWPRYFPRLLGTIISEGSLGEVVAIGILEVSGATRIISSCWPRYFPRLLEAISVRSLGKVVLVGMVNGGRLFVTGTNAEVVAVGLAVEEAVVGVKAVDEVTVVVGVGVAEVKVIGSSVDKDALMVTSVIKYL